MGFFEGENFHEFHKLNTIHEIFTLKIFTVQRALIKTALFKYFKVDECVKEDNSDVVLPSSSGSLAKTIPSSQIDTVNSTVKPVVEAIMDKGKATRGTYEKFSADEKACTGS